jgi:hypothetical protein
VLAYVLRNPERVDLFWPPGLYLEIPGRKRIWGAVAGADRIGARREAVPEEGMVPLTWQDEVGETHLPAPRRPWGVTTTPAEPARIP